LIDDTSEGFGSENSQNSEAIQHVAELYNTEQLTLSNVTATGTIKGTIIIPTDKISSTERLHLSGTKDIYLSGQDVVVGKESGGNGNLNVEGTIEIGGGLLGSHEDLSIASKGSLSLDSSSVTSSGDFTSEGNTFSNRNKARYIDVGNSDSALRAENWQIAQVEVYDDDGVNIAKGKKVEKISGTEHKDSKSETAITDGKMFSSSKFADNKSVCYIGKNSSKHKLRIDLGAEMYINQIVVYGRYTEYAIKDNNLTIIKLLGADGKTVNRTIHTGLWNRTFSKEFLLN